MLLKLLPNYQNTRVFITADRQEKERVDARNALEEYVYELRGKLSSEDDLATFVTDSDRSTLVNQLDEMENWLYEDGEECNRQVSSIYGFIYSQLNYYFILLFI